MSYQSVPCYTALCDGCGADAMEGMEYSGYVERLHVDDTAADGGWYVRNIEDGRHFCPDCPPSWCLQCDADITPANPRCTPADRWSCASCHTDCDHAGGDS